MPWWTALFVSAQAWAMEPVPRPASLEKIPRETPFFMLKNMLPMMPPVAAWGVNALLKIMANTAGTRLICKITTPIARITYKAAINGTSFSETWPIRWIPPSNTMATKAAMKIPKIWLARSSTVPSMICRLCSAEWIEETMVLTWVAFPVPNTVRTPNRA